MIYLHDYLSPGHVCFLSETDKESVMERMAREICKSEKIVDEQGFKKALYEREEIMSTGIGLGIAIPHVKHQSVSDMVIYIGIAQNGIPWDAIDNKPVRLVFMIAGAEDQQRAYLQVLSKIILVLKKKDRREKLLSAADTESVIENFNNL